MNKVTAVCLFLINKEGKVLVVSRKDNSETIGLPGGKVDEGETPLMAAIRELKEETGLDAEELQIAYTGICEGPKSFMTRCYLCQASGELKDPEGLNPRYVDKGLLLTNSPFSDYNEFVIYSVTR